MPEDSVPLFSDDGVEQSDEIVTGGNFYVLYNKLTVHAPGLL